MLRKILPIVIGLVLVAGLALAWDSQTQQFNSSDGSAVTQSIRTSYTHHVLEVNGTSVQVDISVPGSDRYATEDTLTNESIKFNHVVLDSMKLSASGQFNATLYSWHY